MPLQDYMKLISTDDHIIEHRDVWTSRLPKRYVDAGPHVIEVDGEITGEVGFTSTVEHRESWVYEGRPYPNIALNAVAGRPREEYGVEPVRYDEIRPGCYDPNERVKDMDEDGVQAQLGFPTMPGFAGRVFVTSEDRVLGLLSVQAYNDFNIDEWCASHPDRFIPMIILPLWDAELSRKEVERCAAKGARAISFPDNPAGLDLPSIHSEHWDGVFAAAAEAEMPLCMHFGTSTRMPFVSPDAPWPVMIALMGSTSASALAEMLFSPMFHKFPKLKALLSEGGIGWMPWLLDRMDYTWERHRFYTNINRDVRPSEVFRDHVFGCYIDDEAGLELRHRIGVDQITWECDYPHSDSAWPHSRKRAAETLADVPDDEAHRIVELTARRLFRFHPAA